MTRTSLGANEFLDAYVLNAELAKLANVSVNAYTFWASAVAAKYPHSRVVFLRRDSVAPKFRPLLARCTRLDGLVLASAFCAFSGLASSHLVRSNGSSIYSLIRQISVCGVKFVDLRQFYDDLGLSYDKQIYIEKSKFFSPSPLERQIRLTPTLSLGYY
ncbi:cysteine permease [Campylobacter sp. 19-13652]|uniref:cysteine permease n=1 Tax=Campylobacter sp. 19-13652 TaxID=2840180 RepID=UPI001C865EBD|nr:cysteine permease [Campylobacter sp. 19-13652]